MNRFVRKGLLVLSGFLLFSCEDPQPAGEQAPVISTVVPAPAPAEALLQTQDLFVYDVSIGEFDEPEPHTVVYVSLSDNYPLSEHPDSLAIPDISRWSKSEQQYFRLPPAYRDRMLFRMGIRETDSLFLYDFARNNLKAFPVKRLHAVACLSPYETEPPFYQSSYMIGFELAKEVISPSDPYAQHALVCIGRANPFAAEGLQPMRWQAIKPGEVPHFDVRADFKESFGSARKKEAYRFDWQGYTYFVQDYAPEENTEKRRVLVVAREGGQLVHDWYLYDAESNSPAPLNGLNPEVDSNQWTGRLFKNRPPVFFGFEYTSFGCGRISFLSPQVADLYLSCDNRH